jgi:hypothetical protein
VFPDAAPTDPVATHESEIALPPDGVTLTDSMQYAPPPAEQGSKDPLGSVMLALAVDTPTVTVAIAKIAEVILAKIWVRFIVQNYRLTIR